MGVWFHLFLDVAHTHTCTWTHLLAHIMLFEALMSQIYVPKDCLWTYKTRAELYLTEARRRNYPICSASFDVPYKTKLQHNPSYVKFLITEMSSGEHLMIEFRSRYRCAVHITYFFLLLCASGHVSHQLPICYFQSRTVSLIGWKSLSPEMRLMTADGSVFFYIFHLYSHKWLV